MAHTALLLSIAGVCANIRGCVGDDRGYEAGMNWGWIFGLAGMAVSLVTVLAGLLLGPTRAAETLVTRSPSLLLPYLLIQPHFYFTALGMGLGGDQVATGRFAFYSLVALALGVATFAVILWGHLRSRR